MKISLGKRMCKRMERFGQLLIGAGILLFAAHALYSMIAAYSQLNFVFYDYGVYTNSLWNVSRGNGFTFLVDHSYMLTHLSFSLALLAPLYWIFDSPLLLIFVQWGFILAGGSIFYVMLRREQLPTTLILAFLFWFIANPFTQSVALSEFHGVSAYYLLVPLLIATLRTRPRLSWIPFVLLLGLREDAGLYLPLMCGYVAWTQKKSTGFILALLAIGYTIIAIGVLYPAINDTSLFAHRQREISPIWNAETVAIRFIRSFWFFLPVIPLLFLYPKSWRTLLAFAGLPWLVTLLSGDPSQYSLGFHYPSITMASLSAGIPLAISTLPRDRLKRFAPWVTLSIIALTGLAHLRLGFYLGGGRSNPVYAQPSDRGRLLLDIGKNIPKQGLLMCDQWLGVFTANRQDIMVWRHRDGNDFQEKFVLCLTENIGKPEFSTYHQGLEEKTWGVQRLSYPYIVLERGGDPTQNAEIRESVAHKRLPASELAKHGGENQWIKGQGLLRYWQGQRSNFPQTVAYGRATRLPPGKWEVRFTYKALPPEWSDRPETGWLSVHPFNQDPSLAKEKIIIPLPDANQAYSQQSLWIDLDSETDVEVRMTGASASLWLKYIDFIYHPTMNVTTAK
ncbi:DUF2079 domain-containing protein [Kiritimatiellota bacterium B12222]|nr:DUF2079 domain-containing protein [Kiritimatiellota bacterium B12222]